MIANLTATRAGHALFLSNDGTQAVVVASAGSSVRGPFPEYEVIPDNWDYDPDPGTVSDEMFRRAIDAFSDVVVVTAGGSRSGKRTYAVPRYVRNVVSRALAAGGGSDIDTAIAKKLTSGKPVSIETVNHIFLYHDFRETNPSALTAAADFWGGSAGAAWSEKIVAKEAALTAAAEAAAAEDAKSGITSRGTTKPTPLDDLGETEDGPSAYEYDWEFVDPKEGHVFEPLSLVNPYDCAYCFASEGALIHVDSMEAQVAAQFGADSPEMESYREYVSQFDDDAAPLPAMAASGARPSTTERPLLASAFFEDHESEDDCEYGAEMDENDGVSAIYRAKPDGSWHKWNGESAEWDECGDASESGLIPIDDGSAYVVAMKQAHDKMMSVPMHEIHRTESAMHDAAHEEIAAEVDDFDAIVPEFFVQCDEKDDSLITGLYAHREGNWMVWDGNPGEWVPSPAPSQRLMQVEDEEAQEVAMWLSSAANAPDAPDTETQFALLAAVPKTGHRAKRADQPGVVPSMGSRVRGSYKSPYTSNTVRGRRKNAWGSQPSGGGNPGYGPSTPMPGTSTTQGYTPQERSANASKQVRDAFGRFAKGGSTVNFAGGTGTISKINPDTKQVKVDVANPDGTTTSSWMNASDVAVQPTPQPRSPYYASNDGGEVWLPADGPRATKYTPKAQLGQLQPILDSAALNAMLDNVSAYFAEERARAAKINQNWNSTGRAITAGGNTDGVMVAFFLDPKTAARYAVPGGEAPENMHLTLAYLGNKDEVPCDANRLAEIVSTWAASTAQVKGEISGSGVFTNGDDPVLHLSVDCPDLPAARQSLIETLQRAGIEPRMNHGFDPHITLAYGATDVDPAPASPVSFDRVVVSYGDSDKEIPLGSGTVAAAGEVALTPDTSDVKPIYLAIVDKLDRSAVMDLLALVPATATSTQPLLYKRTAKGWERDDNLMSSLRGATPPPVVTLDDATYKSVLSQVDQTLAADKPVAASGAALYNEYGELVPAIVAAGGVDRNRGDAERLRRYWTVGPGGAKIRWGQGGDWYRCVRHLSKYLGVRAKGYCQLRHQEMVRMSTAEHAKVLHGGKRGVRGSGIYVFRLASDTIVPKDKLDAVTASAGCDFAVSLEPTTTGSHALLAKIPQSDELRPGDRFAVSGPDGSPYVAEVFTTVEIGELAPSNLLSMIAREGDTLTVLVDTEKGA